MIRTSIVFLATFVAGLSAPPARADTKTDPLDQAASSFAKLGDIRVHYKSFGTGDTALVFIHGWTADMNSWKYQVPAFSGKLRVVLIDLPGHGKSDKPKTDYTMDLFAKSIDAVLTEAGIDKAILVGHSMGTPVIRQFYRLFPQKTLALVAVDGLLRPPVAGSEQVKKFIARFSGPDFDKNYEKFIASMFTPRTPPSVRKELKETLPAAPQHVAVSAMEGMFNPAAWKDDAIKVPLFVVVAKSPRWSADYVAYVHKLAPDVDYQVMEGVGHFLMLENPDGFNDMVTAFLRKRRLLK